MNWHVIVVRSVELRHATNFCLIREKNRGQRQHAQGGNAGSFLCHIDAKMEIEYAFHDTLA